MKGNEHSRKTGSYENAVKIKKKNECKKFRYENIPKINISVMFFYYKIQDVRIHTKFLI